MKDDTNGPNIGTLIEALTFATISGHFWGYVACCSPAIIYVKKFPGCNLHC
jgi:hypothetical protein